ncbi:MAG: hypothetical protein R3A13_07845 [Bdellovibrionota bacterium]
MTSIILDDSKRRPPKTMTPSVLRLADRLPTELVSILSNPDIAAVIVGPDQFIYDNKSISELSELVQTASSDTEQFSKSKDRETLALASLEFCENLSKICAPTAEYHPSVNRFELIHNCITDMINFMSTATENAELTLCIQLREVTEESLEQQPPSTKAFKYIDKPFARMVVNAGGFNFYSAGAEGPIKLSPFDIVFSEGSNPNSDKGLRKVTPEVLFTKRISPVGTKELIISIYADPTATFSCQVPQESNFKTR